jgi:polysaccharide export outer membrane protein
MAVNYRNSPPGGTRAPHTLPSSAPVRPASRVDRGGRTAHQSAPVTAASERGMSSAGPVFSRRMGLLGLGAVALASCAPGRDLAPLPDARNTSYTLGIGDQVRIITVGGEQLTGDFRVNDAGDISIPLLGTVHAAGLTTAQLEQAISKGLQDKKLFRDPSVAVEVLNYRPIFILGEVTKPGEYAYQPGMTMLTAVSVAGGFTYRAVTDYASVVRTNGDHPVEGKIGRQSFILPGDVITIYERIF